MNVIELHDALDVIAGAEPMASELGLAEVRASVRRRRRTVIAAFVATLALLVLAGGFVVRSGGSTESVSSVSRVSEQANGRRAAVFLPDGSVGWVDQGLLVARPESTPGQSSTALDAYHRLALPVTKSRSARSRVVGDYFRGFGFVPLATTKSPGYSVEGALSRGTCPMQTLLTIVGGSYVCTAIASDAPPLGTPAPTGTAPQGSNAASSEEPPTADPAQVFSGPRVGVGDSTGRVRGTIPTEAYLNASKADAAERETTSVDVVDTNGKLTGYWYPIVGFVELDVANAPGFDVRAYAAEQELARWNALTEAQRQSLEQQGFRAPGT